MDTQASNEGRAIRRANSYRPERPKTQRKSHKRYGKQHEPLFKSACTPATPAVELYEMPSFLERMLMNGVS